jgi:hypothetical protein
LGPLGDETFGLVEKKFVLPELKQGISSNAADYASGSNYYNGNS